MSVSTVWRAYVGDTNEPRNATLNTDLTLASAVVFEAQPFPRATGQTSITDATVTIVSTSATSSVVSVDLPALVDADVGTYVAFFQVTDSAGVVTFPNDKVPGDFLVVDPDPSGV